MEKTYNRKSRVIPINKTFSKSTTFADLKPFIKWDSRVSDYIGLVILTEEKKDFEQKLADLVGERRIQFFQYTLERHTSELEKISKGLISVAAGDKGPQILATYDQGSRFEQQILNDYSLGRNPKIKGYASSVEKIFTVTLKQLIGWNNQNLPLSPLEDCYFGQPLKTVAQSIFSETIATSIDRTIGLRDFIEYLKSRKPGKKVPHEFAELKDTFLNHEDFGRCIWAMKSVSPPIIDYQNKYLLKKREKGAVTAWFSAVRVYLKEGVSEEKIVKPLNVFIQGLNTSSTTLRKPNTAAYKKYFPKLSKLLNKKTSFRN